MPQYSLPNVSSGVWCMSVLAPGTILTDIDVYKQRCYIVLNTPLNSDPLRPLFGCDYFKYIDGNIITAPAKIKREIIEAITIWVPEVKLGKVTYATTAGKVVFTIRISFGSSNISFPFKPGQGSFFGGITGTKIINVAFPWNTSNATIAFTANGVNVPLPGGPLPWADIPGMMAWLKANWGIYGTWGYSKDEIILYLDPAYSTATIVLTKLS